MANTFELLSGLDAGDLKDVNVGDARKLMLGSVTTDGRTAADFGFDQISNPRVETHPHHVAEVEGEPVDLPYAREVSEESVVAGSLRGLVEPSHSGSIDFSKIG